MRIRTLDIMAFHRVSLLFTLLTNSLMISSVSAIDIPNAHPKFNSTYHDIAAKIVNDRYLNLPTNQLRAFQDVVTDLRITLDANIKNLLNLKETSWKNPEELQKIIKDKLSTGDITQADVENMVTQTNGMQQKYTSEVIKTFNLTPGDLKMTAQDFCDVFSFCNFTSTSTKASSTTSRASTTPSSTSKSSSTITPSTSTMSTSTSVTSSMSSSSTEASTESTSLSTTVAAKVDETAATIGDLKEMRVGQHLLVSTEAPNLAESKGEAVQAESGSQRPLSSIGMMPIVAISCLLLL